LSFLYFFSLQKFFITYAATATLITLTLTTFTYTHFSQYLLLSNTLLANMDTLCNIADILHILYDTHPDIESVLLQFTSSEQICDIILYFHHKFQNETGYNNCKYEFHDMSFELDKLIEHYDDTISSFDTISLFDTMTYILRIFADNINPEIDATEPYIIQKLFQKFYDLNEFWNLISNTQLFFDTIPDNLIAPDEHTEINKLFKDIHTCTQTQYKQFYNI
jgi:hypothetical protein